MAEDGAIEIGIHLTDAEAQKELNKIQRKIESLGYSIEKLQADRFPLAEKAGELGAALEKANAQLQEMQADSSGAFTSGQIADQKEQVKSLTYQYNQADAAVERIDDKLKGQKYDLDAARKKAGELSARLADAGDAADELGGETKQVDKYMERFTKRISGLVKRVFIFSVFTAALRGLRSYMGKVIKTNSEAMEAIARLKGALLTLAQPIVNIIIPVLTKLMNTLTRIINTAAELVSTLFGTTAQESRKAAENLYDEASALDEVGDSAEGAGKNVASFDTINKLSDGADNSSKSDKNKPDFTGNVGDGLSAVAQLLTGVALMALGAVLTFSGAHIALGLSLIVAGALAIYDAVTTNPEAIKTFIQKNLNDILVIATGFLLAIGLVLAMSGTNIPLGIGLIAAGAVGLAAIAALNWGAIKTALQGPLGLVTALVSTAVLALGAILAFSGANIPLGLGLMAAGATGLGAAIAANWGKIKEFISKNIGEIMGILAAALLVIGAIFTFSGNFGLGLGLMAAGAASLAAGAAINWDALKEALQGPIGWVVAAMSGALLVVGAILTFSGANMLLGMGLMAAGAVGLAAPVVANWNSIAEALQGPIGKATAMISGALLVLGAVLAFSGINIPLGLGLMAAGGIGLGAVAAANWDAITDKLAEVWDSIKTWFSNHVAKYFTLEYWKEKAESIVQGFLDGLGSIFSKLNDWAKRVKDTIKSVFSFGSSKTLKSLPTMPTSGSSYALPSAYKLSGIPHLASGAVIPPNQEFLAILGDQKRGTNIEAPVSEIEAAVARGMGANNNGQSININFKGSLSQLARLLQPEIEVVSNYRGTNLVKGGAR